MKQQIRLFATLLLITLGQVIPAFAQEQPPAGGQQGFPTNGEPVQQSQPVVQPSRQYYQENKLYQEQRYFDRKVIEWPHLREADVMWRRQIWREIDLREKANLCMVWPKNPINEIIVRNVNAGHLFVYPNDSLSSPLTTEMASKKGGREVNQQKLIDPEDPDAGTIDTTIYEQLRPEDIIRYKLIEEWVFDKKHAIMRSRIIAVIPIINRKNNAGEIIGAQDLYFIKYEDFRKLMVNEQMYNRQNDAMRITYDDFFEQRLFSSFITKESNAYDFQINQMAEFETDKLATLLEADRIRQELFIFEHDLWEY